MDDICKLSIMATPWALSREGQLVLTRGGYDLLRYCQLRASLGVQVPLQKSEPVKQISGIFDMGIFAIAYPRR